MSKIQHGLSFGVGLFSIPATYLVKQCRHRLSTWTTRGGKDNESANKDRDRKLEVGYIKVNIFPLMSSEALATNLEPIFCKVNLAY